MQREFRQLIREVVADGATVFLCSPVLSEVEFVCDRIGLIRDGRLGRVGSLDELRAVRIHRVEAVLNGRLNTADGPVPWPQLIWQRMLAALLEVAVITTAALVGLAGAAAAVGAGLSGPGLIRHAADTILLFAPVAGVAAFVVAWLRRAAAELAELAALTALGGLSAAALAQRSPKVAT